MNQYSMCKQIIFSWLQLISIHAGWHNARRALIHHISRDNFYVDSQTSITVWDHFHFYDDDDDDDNDDDDNDNNQLLYIFLNRWAKRT